MDKLFRSSWFIKILSFIVALMLYTVVSSEINNQSSPTSFIDTSNGEEIAIFTEELAVRYDENKYVVQGVPNQIKVRIKGTKEAVQKIGWNITKNAFIDLTDKGPGTYKVKVQTEGFSNNVTVNVNPSHIKVTVMKKVSETFPALIDVIHKDSLPKGYKIGTPETETQEVTVTGGEPLVESVAYVKGVVDAQGATEDITTEVTLNAYDKKGNQLKLTLDPVEIDVTVPVVSPSKEVKVPVKTDGELPEGVSISSIKVEPAKVKIFGSKEALKKITELEPVTVDLSDIEEDETVELELKVPDGLQKHEPNTVKVHVDIAPTATRVLKNVSIEIRGLGESDTSVEFVSPDDRSIKVTLKGAAQVLEQLNRGDIDAYIDVSGLTEGIHTLDIQLDAPKYTEGDLEMIQATIEIKGNANS